MKPSKILAAVIATTMLTACTEPNGAPGRGIENGGALSATDVGVVAGAVTGGVLGGLVGNGWGTVAAAAGGAVVGGVVGGGVGHHIDRHRQHVYERAMNTGRAQTWQEGEESGMVYPHKRYKDADGRYCREYTHDVMINGKKERANGVACRAEDGSWRFEE